MKRLLGLSLASLLAVAQPASAQGDTQDRIPPQFLLAVATGTAPLDVERMPVLMKRLALDFDGVSVREALRTITARTGLRLAYNDDLIPLSSRVHLRADNITAAAALTDILLGTGVDIVFRQDDHAVLVKRPTPPETKARPRLGVITGRVTDAVSSVRVSGASVVVEGTQLSAITGNTGRYRIPDVPAGTYTVVVQQLGYAEARKSVTVSDGEDAETDFALEVSALPLDEVVATGTAFATKVRTMPNPINVITAEEIEAKGSASITELLRGEIPGVMPLSAGQNDYYSYIYVRGNASSGGSIQDLIKIYIDGVEVANPSHISTIDPKSIERIEVVRGPQASVIYGSEAASGVLQIFTKKGRAGQARPHVDAQMSAGVIESAYTPSGAGTPLTQDYSLEVSGGGESFSYRAGASYATAGEWVKHYGSKTLGLSGGMRAVHGPLTAELTALWSDRNYSYGNHPLYLHYPADACVQCGNPDYVDNRNYALSQNTMGLALRYRATPRWQHTLMLGDDQNRVADHQPAPSFNSPADTFVELSNSETRRRSVRYHTAYDAELGERMTVRLTAGADYWSYDVQGGRASNLLNAFGTVRTSPSTFSSFKNDGWWNVGYFGMAELGWQDVLFMTVAGRVEDNRNLGEDYGRAFAPKVGAAWVRALGPVEIKLRAQWGKSVRPPPPEARSGRVVSDNVVILPNPSIGPEEKSGWDAGVDLYWGRRASFSLTRFDEEAQNLIYYEAVDLTVTPNLRQYRNIGEVSLKGWEAEGQLSVGRVTLSANYAYSDNVVKKVDAATAADPNAVLQVGDRTFSAPRHSGGGRVALQVGRGSVSMDGSVMAGWRDVDYTAYFDWLYAGEPYRGSLRAYYVEYPSLWKWNLRAEQAVGERWSAFLRVENVTNNQAADRFNLIVAPGRTTVVGARWSF